ncbi:sigma-70 family RNA polymerase sigma factor [Chitinophaga polysaccharea]|uniref:RNA polymerase sigma factor n=1 Tax=Chitinophaga TaxID=79328 RepID=UPI00145534C8|nr:MULTISPECIES: sigma-70 family RNA polymerase sigma factor [Chitinophaga]NLR62620.1 sigma-70 family RNA polymerase sigma factor [Chitinophaga polysaccharea]NLU91428.1 sigma-70 family RNA polymerase sigma factor [Chitinophaga sp. Ak27]
MDNNTGHELALFRQIAMGDEAAFASLFHLYVPKIKPVITQIIRVEGPEKDIIQEIFLGIWLGREKLNEVAVPHNWIFKMVYYRCYTWLERQGVRNKAVHIMGLKNPLVSNFTEENLSFSETAMLVKQAIQQLPPQAKKIYMLSREGGLKITEIASQLDLSPQTIKNSLVRSLKSIREFLVEHGVILPLILLEMGILFFC